jgi:hypothetical protein
MTKRSKRQYAMSIDTTRLIDPPDPFWVGPGKPPTKVTGDFSTTRLTRVIHKLFGGTGKPENTEDKES